MQIFFELIFVFNILVCLFSQRYNMGGRTNQPDFLMEVVAMIVLKILAAPVMVALAGRYGHISVLRGVRRM